eukprot:scaffold296298_cov22-Tisochrysis_lutea.AAC.1
MCTEGGKAQGDFKHTQVLIIPCLVTQLHSEVHTSGHGIVCPNDAPAMGAPALQRHLHCTLRYADLVAWALGTTTATVLTRAILAEGCKSVAAGPPKEPSGHKMHVALAECSLLQKHAPAKGAYLAGWHVGTRRMQARSHASAPPALMPPPCKRRMLCLAFVMKHRLGPAMISNDHASAMLIVRIAGLVNRTREHSLLQSFPVLQRWIKCAFTWDPKQERTRLTTPKPSIDPPCRPFPCVAPNPASSLICQPPYLWVPSTAGHQPGTHVQSLAIISRMSFGMNPMDLRRGINTAVDTVVSTLKSRAKGISTTEEIAQVNLPNGCVQA